MKRNITTTILLIILNGILQLRTNAFLLHSKKRVVSHSLAARKKSAPTTLTSSSSRQNRVQSLMDWATTAQIQSSGIRILSDSFNGLGWFSTKSLDSGSVVLSVPSSMALSVESPGDGPDDSNVAKLLNDRSTLGGLPWFVQMALYLHKLDKIDSTKGSSTLDLRTWLDSLPRQFDTPVHWSPDEMKYLQYDYMTNQVQRQEKTWKSYHQKLIQAGLSGCSWEEFLWGAECARSRAFSGAYTGSAFNPLIYAFTLLLVTIYVGLNLGTLEQAANGAGVVVSASILRDFVLPKFFKKKRYIICPMIDMANHKSVGASGEVSFEYFGNAYSLALGKPVNADEQVFISYGSRSNDQLLQYYGFIEENNPNDVYVMPPLREWDIGALEEACGRKFAVGRLEKLERAGLLGGFEPTKENENDDGGEAAMNQAGGVVLSRVVGLDPAVLQALRALVSTDEEWESRGQAIGNFAEENAAGKENEMCARLAARKAIEMELRSKPTSIEEDLDLLKKMSIMKSLDASRAEQLAVQFRIEKKRILEESIKKLE